MATDSVGLDVGLKKFLLLGLGFEKRSLGLGLGLGLVS